LLEIQEVRGQPEYMEIQESYKTHGSVNGVLDIALRVIRLTMRGKRLRFLFALLNGSTIKAMGFTYMQFPR
jgi:hypothetical protein